MRPTAFLSLLALLFSCSNAEEQSLNGLNRPASEVEPFLKPDHAAILSLDTLYRSYGVEGCFVLYNLKSDSLSLYNATRCEQGFLPASSYKIPNSLIALETGVIKSPEDTIFWDGTERWNGDWNRDNTLAEAFRVSCVPCYQQIARKVGVQRMQEWTTKAEYGQLDIGEDNIDTFWLEGDSRVTPLQQARFLIRLYREQLPFRKEHQHTVKQVMLLEETPEYRLYGKTGWAQPDGRNIGWFVGFFEKGDEAYVFVNNVGNEQAPEGENGMFQRCRREIVEKVFKKIMGEAKKR
ncbi:MAG: class D beta-lactamase [Phaeodactylibacter sp.]|nr:class D beta-lactamase [Phaeodactylibacter sp.]